MKAIIKLDFNSQSSYVTRIDNNKITQVSNTYCSGVIEFENKKSAELQASKLKLKKGLVISILEVN